ncbi:MAG: Asp-tRNA(Asn)/Glu-tRNA(Gln) amidotransferase subunit GatC [Chloroflexi bacterium]|nr:Asp-tRNA(Asn)/Glu-tRNA(Gln) amidotransferase subunit GatC [Chloroflexota bacterium]
MRLSREQVLHIAELARLALDEQETELFAEQLSTILDYFEMLNRLDTKDVPPTAYAVDMQNVTRPDVVCPSLSREQALANAPRQKDGFFQVKRILES